MVRSPFLELDPGHQERMEPAAHIHLRGGKTISPVAFTAFRQVTKEASRYLKLFEMRQQDTTGSHSEASSDPTGVHEMAFLIISDQDRIHDPIIWNVASDDELLTAIGPPF